MLDPKGSGAKDHARCFVDFVFNEWASITGAVDAFGWWWAHACSFVHSPTLTLCNTFAPVLTLVMRMKGVTKGIVERSATVPQGPEPKTLRRFNVVYHCFFIGCLMAFQSFSTSAQQVVEIYNEKGHIVFRLNGDVDSILFHVDRLPRSRYLVSVSSTTHPELALKDMSLRCMFHDVVSCQSLDPLNPDSIYKVEGFYDGYWISIDRRDEHARLLWEKHIQDGFIHGLCIVYSDKQIPVYMANFKAGLLDGLVVRYDYESGYYSGSLYSTGNKIRSVNWAIDGRMFFDTVWKPVLPR